MALVPCSQFLKVCGWKSLLRSLVDCHHARSGESRGAANPAGRCHFALEIERMFPWPRLCGGCREESRLQLHAGPFRGDGPADDAGFGSSQVLMEGAERI